MQGTDKEFRPSVINLSDWKLHIIFQLRESITNEKSRSYGYLPTPAPASTDT